MEALELDLYKDIAELVAGNDDAPAPELDDIVEVAKASQNPIETLGGVFGSDEVIEAIGKLFEEKLAEATGAAVQGSGLPPFEQNVLQKAIADAGFADSASGSGVEQAVDAVFGEEIAQLAEQSGERIFDTVSSAPPEALPDPGYGDMVPGPEQFMPFPFGESSAPGSGLGPVEEGFAQGFEEGYTAAMEQTGGATGPMPGGDAEGGTDPMEDLMKMFVEGWLDERMDEAKKAMAGSGGQSQNNGNGGTVGAAGGGAAGAESVGAAGGAEGAGGAAGAEGGGAVGSEGGGAAGAEGGAGAEGAPEAEAPSGGPGGTGSASDANSGTGGSASATGNWLTVLAGVLGEASGKHLKSMVDLGEQMGAIDSEANPEEFAKINAEFSAESQIFKMFQEAISTMIKSIGEGMSSVARKS